jgi:hypothetical protein
MLCSHNIAALHKDDKADRIAELRADTGGERTRDLPEAAHF